MNDPYIIVCDDQGKPTGEYIPKEEGHTGKGKRHLAITVLIYNLKGEVLLQKRKHKRFDNIWDLTGATDLRHFKDNSDETFEQATFRCLKREYNINPKDIKNLKKVGAFNYFAQYGELCEYEAKPLFCENEHCAMLVGEYDEVVEMNPEVGYEYKWMDEKGFLKDIQSNPQNYTPWAIEGSKFLG